MSGTMKYLILLAAATLTFGNHLMGSQYFDSPEDSMEEWEKDFIENNHEDVPLTDTDIEDWESAALKLINKYRARADLPPYSYDKKLAATSQVWAEQIKCGDMDHDPNGVAIETLAETGSSSKGKVQSALDAVDAWWDEHKKYDCNKPIVPPLDDYGQTVGHFASLMRTDVQSFGLRMAFCKNRKPDGGGYVVGRYAYLTPDGNWDAWNAQLKKQGLPEGDTGPMDINGLVPCPLTYKNMK